MLDLIALNFSQIIKPPCTYYIYFISPEKQKGEIIDVLWSV